ncbi:unnamed protein product [Colias eurytheme]|nr:unnamed protein product [Colias eurytheme]
MENLKDNIAQMTENFNTRMAEFQKQLQSSNTPASSNITTEFSLFQSFILSSLKILQSEVEMLFKLHDIHEMRSRRKILLLHGVKEDNKEDTKAVVLATLSSKLQSLNLDEDSFSRCHRMGHVSTSAAKPRPLLVKFRDVGTKNSVWFSKTKFKNSGVTLSEFLTKSRHETFMAARKKFGLPKCWTKDGNVFVVGSDGEKYQATCLSDLDSIPCARVDNVQLTSSVPLLTDSNNCSKAISRPKRMGNKIK